MKNVIQDKTMCLALFAWMGDGKWLRCFPHGWYLMNQRIVCQLFVLFLRFGSHMKLSPLLNFIWNVFVDFYWLENHLVRVSLFLLSIYLSSFIWNMTVSQKFTFTCFKWNLVVIFLTHHFVIFHMTYDSNEVLCACILD